MRPLAGLATAVLIVTSASAWRQSGSVPPEWEVRAQVGALAAGLERLKPLLEQVRPQEWVARGAPQGYVGQHRTIGLELGYLERSARILADRPDRLPAALDTFFRVERLQALMSSLCEGVRRYQNPALADLIESVVSESAPARESLRQYVLDLAEVKERQLAVADQEAQRCRALLIRQPPARSSPPARKDPAASREQP